MQSLRLCFLNQVYTAIIAVIIAIAVAFMISKQPPETHDPVWKMSLLHEVDFEESELKKSLVS